MQSAMHFSLSGSPRTAVLIGVAPSHNRRVHCCDFALKTDHLVGAAPTFGSEFKSQLRCVRDHSKSRTEDIRPRNISMSQDVVTLQRPFGSRPTNAKMASIAALAASGIPSLRWAFQLSACHFDASIERKPFRSGASVGHSLQRLHPGQ
jgi:hypothetical protein